MAGKLRRGLVEGDSFFQGVHTQVRDFGDELREAVRSGLQEAVPKFDLAAVPVKSAATSQLHRGGRARGIPQDPDVPRGALQPPTGSDRFPKLTECAQALERLYGVQVAIEEGAIANVIRSRMPDEGLLARGALNLLEANRLPGSDIILDLTEKVGGVAQGGAEDVVLAFHEQRDAIAAGLERLKKLEAALGSKNLGMLRRARSARAPVARPPIRGRGGCRNWGRDAEAGGRAGLRRVLRVRPGHWTARTDRAGSSRKAT